MADYVPNNGKKPFIKFDTRFFLFLLIWLITLNICISYYLFVSYRSLIKPVLPLDVQVKNAIQQQKDLYKMTEKIKKISTWKTVDEE